jgi:hypothetical protein
MNSVALPGVWEQVDASILKRDYNGGLLWIEAYCGYPSIGSIRFVAKAMVELAGFMSAAIQIDEVVAISNRCEISAAIDILESKMQSWLDSQEAIDGFSIQAH